MLMFGLPSGASELGSTSDVLTAIAPDDPSCVSNGREPYEDAAFVGEVESWLCDFSVYITLAANPAGVPDAIVVIGVVAVTEADLEAFDTITFTFNFL